MILTFGLIVSCSLGKRTTDKQVKNDTTKVDSVSYQKGIEHAVDEKLLKKYKR